MSEKMPTRQQARVLARMKVLQPHGQRLAVPEGTCGMKGKAYWACHAERWLVSWQDEGAKFYWVTITAKGYTALARYESTHGPVEP